MGRLFGTDGVRGIVNRDLTPELAFNLGKAGTYVLNKEKERPVIIIGKDTRISGDLLEDAMSAGILSMGGNVIKVGVLPTPAIAYLVRHLHADAGVMISASHNTFEYNGIKFFNHEGFKLDDDLEDEIEDIITRDIDINGHITGDKIGRCVEADKKALEYYVQFLYSTAPLDLTGKKLVLDCANGAAYQAAKMVFQKMGATVIAMADEPDGLNINAGCGSTHPEALQHRVLMEKANLGLAFDGDADRLIAVDEKGELIDGDKMLCICAKMMKDTGCLYGDMVTATVMSNLGLHKYLESIGVTRDITNVGDRYVLERMLKTGCLIGGEQSGHLIFLNYTTTGDGILSALQFMKALTLDERTPSQIAGDISLYPQVLKNAAIKEENKRKYERDTEIKKEIKRLEQLMAGEGRVLIRPSGTEPLVRVMIEGKDQKEITKLAEGLARLVTKRFG
ncbi:MAG TPA: phosphoglucosamine mutase [Bacillota bacterium]|nr:phosphoglucosamine mutase [Bacillota bacterium]